MIGGQGSPYLAPNQIQLTFGYRFQKSDKHYTGSHHDVEREAEGSEVINTISLFDVSATYAATERLNFSLSLPILLAQRSYPIRDSSRNVVGRYSNHSHGIGDLSVVGSWWLFDTDEHLTENVSIGIGAKFPTGQDNLKGKRKSADGSVTTRTLDQSIQPGDGGYGAVIQLQAFATPVQDLVVFAQGNYLFNPQDTNGVKTGRSNPEEQIMSIADQYLARVGAVMPLLKQYGLFFSIAGRLEGIPSHDLIGKSDGFRRPGYIVSVSPGLILSIKQHTFSLSAPLAVYRNRVRSVPDQRTGRHGDAAFADYLILASYSYRFGVTPGSSEEPTVPTNVPANVPATHGASLEGTGLLGPDVATARNWLP